MQWIFIQFYKRGLAYKKENPVNWCPSCQTVLANEQVVDGCCERCKTPVGKKNLSQWYLKITDYAERLLDNLDKLEGWPNKVKVMQRNWIGKSVGAEVDFKIKDRDETLTVFTTRVDTIYGTTYMVLAPEYPTVLDMVEGTEYEKPVKDYIEKVEHMKRHREDLYDQRKDRRFHRKIRHQSVHQERDPYLYIRLCTHGLRNRSSYGRSCP